MASRSAIRTWSKACSATALDKGARFTDWSRRPLDKRQIDYAIADVTHLAEIFPRAGQEAGQDRPRRLARRGNGAARRSVELRVRTRGRLEAPEAAEPQPGRARPPEGAGRLARDRGAGPRICRAAESSRTIRWTSSPATRPRPRTISAKVRGLSSGWRSNDIGARLMAALATAKPLDGDELPHARAAPAGPDQGSARWSATC